MSFFFTTHTTLNPVVHLFNSFVYSISWAPPPYPPPCRVSNLLLLPTLICWFLFSFFFHCFCFCFFFYYFIEFFSLGLSTMPWCDDSLSFLLNHTPVYRYGSCMERGVGSADLRPFFGCGPSLYGCVGLSRSEPWWCPGHLKWRENPCNWRSRSCRWLERIPMGVTHLEFILLAR